MFQNPQTVFVFVVSSLFWGVWSVPSIGDRRVHERSTCQISQRNKFRESIAVPYRTMGLGIVGGFIFLKYKTQMYFSPLFLYYTYDAFADGRTASGKLFSTGFFRLIVFLFRRCLGLAFLPSLSLSRSVCVVCAPSLSSSLSLPLSLFFIQTRWRDVYPLLQL